MAHFAELNNENKVLRVVNIPNDETHDTDGLEVETLGIAYCKSLFGADTKWVQTSYKNSIRGKFAGIDDIYSEELNRFLNPKPYPSWVYDEILMWKPPIDRPTTAPAEGKRWAWDEPSTSWIEVTND